MIIRKQLLKSKKGDFSSLIILGIIMVFVIAMVGLIFTDVFGEVLGELKDSGIFSEKSTDIMTNVQTQTPKYFDFFVLFMMITAIIGLIIASIYIDLPPGMMVVFIIAMIIAVVLAGQFANIWGETRDVSEVSDTASNLPFSNLILGQAFPIIILITGAIVIIVLYSKSRTGAV